jgi:hypothetical protein
MHMNPTVGRSKPKTALSSVKGLVQSYVFDLRDWAGGLATKYAIAAALLIVGGAFVLASMIVGLVAVFHWVEINYSIYNAYAVVGGGLLVMGVISFLIGLRLIRKPNRQIPLARRQIAIAKSNFVAPVLLGTNPRRGNVFVADPVTGTLAGAAAVLLAAWVAASTLHRSRRRTN